MFLSARCNTFLTLVIVLGAYNPLQMLTLLVSEQIKKLQRNGSVEHEISIIWVPRRTLVSNKILEAEGVLGDVNISELPLFFLPLEDDMLSLELDGAFNDLYLVSLPGDNAVGRALSNLPRET